MTETGDEKSQRSLADFGDGGGDRPAEEAVAVAGNGGPGADVVDPGDHKFPDAEGHVELAVTQVDYTVEGYGDDEYPVLHVFGRTAEREAEHVRVYGFRPYFYAPTDSLSAPPEEEYDRLTGSRETDEDGDPYESIRGERLTKIFGQTPRDVGQLRDDFDHYEADILFPNRLLIDEDITSGVRVPERRAEDGTIRIPHGEIETVELQVEPRVNTFDIEVDDRSGFPEDGEEPIVCLTSHDSYDDEYVVWLYNAPGGDVPPPAELAHHDLMDGAAAVDVRAFDTEEAMLEAFVDYINSVDPDVMTGWNCLPGDSDVLMADGTETQIRDVEVGDRVVGSAARSPTTAEVTNKWESKKEIYEFELADGTSLRSSAEHRVMVGDDDAVEWKRGADIAPGDYVLKPRKLAVETPTVPTRSELVPPDNQQLPTEEAVGKFKERLPRGAITELAGEFGLAKGSLYCRDPTVWTPERCAKAAEKYEVPLPDGGRVYRHTGVDVDRELTEHELYLAGLVLTDGSMSEADGIRFYNTREELHNQFSDDGTLTPDGKGCYKQNVLDYATMHTFHGLGIPFGDKNAGNVDLSLIYGMPETYIARFLAGVIDGDGNISASVTVAAENRSIGEWYVKLFRRLGIYAQQRDHVVRVPDAERDIERLKERVLPHMNHSEKVHRLETLRGGKSGQTENIPYALFEAEVGTDEKRIGNDKWRRGINLKRHETTSGEWENYVFVEVEEVTTAGTETTYDIETTTHNFLAEGCLVHNCDDFDAPYLIARLEELGLEADRLSRVDEVWDGGWGGPDVKGRVVFDLLYAYKRTQFTELESYRLDAVAETELGVGKERYAGDIGDLWEDDPERLLEYNLRDVELCVELDRKQDIVAFWEEVASFVGCKLEDAPTPGDAVDMYVLHKAHGEFVLPSKGKHESEEFEGGAVFDPITGVREMVSVLDLKSLYPMAMITINASPETKATPEDFESEEEFENNTYRAPNDQRFLKEPDGIIREMVNELLEEREEKKGRRNEYAPGSEEYDLYDRQQAAVKVIMNCFTPDTEVLTPDGVRKITDLGVGDEVYSLDPETMEMEVKPVVETHEYPDYRGELVDIETTKVDFRVTPNHRMLVRKNDTNGITEDGWSFVEAGELYDYCHYEMPHDWSYTHPDELGESIDLLELVGKYTETESMVSDGGTKVAAKYGTPNVQRDIAVEDLFDLLAWYITEGSVYVADTANYRVKIAQESKETRGQIEDLIDRLVDYYHIDGRSISFSSRVWGELLESLCGARSADKTIPDLVFRGSESQKQSFLQTLIEGDGDRQPNSWRYSTISEQLRDDVLKLCTELGFTAGVTYESGTWRIHVNEKSKNSFRMHRNSSSSRAENGVYCVTVKDNNTLLAGRNGKYQFIGNSLYGVSGWERFRLYDKESAAAVTATGREVIEFTEDAASELDKDVIYGDTDSVMLELGPEMSKADAIEQSFEIEDHINDRYDEFAREELNAEFHRFEIEFEKLYRRFFQAGKKKRYAGHIVWKEGKDVDDIDITGFEYKRSDIAPITKRVQREVIEMIVTGEDIAEVEGYVHDVIEDFQAGNVDLEEVGIPGGIGKRLDNYDTDTAQVRGAKYANLLLGTNFARGSKPKRLYVERVDDAFFQRVEREKGLDPAEDPLYAEFKREVSAGDGVICFEYADQVPEEFAVDWEKMLDKTLKGPIARVLEALDVSWEEVRTGQEQTGLGQYM